MIGLHLTLLGPERGHICPPCHIFAYISANTRTSALKKIDFYQLQVWKRAVRFLPEKVSVHGSKLIICRHIVGLRHGPPTHLKFEKI